MKSRTFWQALGLALVLLVAVAPFATLALLTFLSLSAVAVAVALTPLLLPRPYGLSPLYVRDEVVVERPALRKAG